MEEGDYKNDKLDGTWVRYYPNGKKGSEQHYKSGLRDGHWSKWYDNGQLAESGDFKNDKLDGVWMHYFPDGQPAVESHYKEGMRDGTWKKWNAPQGSEGPQKKVSKLPDTPFDLDFEDSAPAGKTRH
jgi:antitoxin component YwqK of YwqJK toxin-antitoxin module